MIEEKDYKKLIRIVLIICSLFIVVHYTMTSYFPLFQVYSDSMNTSLRDGDVIIAYRLFKKLNRKDVIIAYSKSQNINVIKRIVALPGDTVTILNNDVQINGKKIHEPYATYKTSQKKIVTFTIPKGSYFIMGDNRNNSIDSRNYGPVPIDKILAKVVLMVYPGDGNFGRIGFVRK